MKIFQKTSRAMRGKSVLMISLLHLTFLVSAAWAASSINHCPSLNQRCFQIQSHLCHHHLYAHHGHNLCCHFCHKRLHQSGWRGVFVVIIRIRITTNNQADAGWLKISSPNVSPFNHHLYPHHCHKHQHHNKHQVDAGWLMMWRRRWPTGLAESGVELAGMICLWFVEPAGTMIAICK